MGVTCIEAFVGQPKYFNKEIYLNAKNAALNVLYRSDEVYKECSVPFEKSNKRRTKIKITKPKKIKCDKENSMCALYDSPTVTLKNEEIGDDEKHDTGKINTLNTGFDNTALDAELKNADDIISLYDKEAESNVSVCTKLWEHKVKTESQINPSAVSPRVKKHNKRTLCKWIGLPKFVCPCCTGGDDSAEAPYKAQSIVDSCESIYGLHRASSTINSLNGSVLNISNHPKNIKFRNTMKLYTKVCKLYKACNKNRVKDDEKRKYKKTRNTKSNDKHFYIYTKCTRKFKPP